ncbi:MAG: putative baseplate assembly protein [Bryobacterales bacterium]|nr:putative baseplate assembly protein [Bryobacterales bacterium]
MIRHQDLLCRVDTRRPAIISSPTLQGVEYLEVVTSPETDDQRVLLVYFLPKQGPGAAALIQLLDTLAANSDTLLAITGGVRIRDVAILNAAREGDHLRLRVNHPGDFTDYTLRITPPLPAGPADPVLDPAYASIVFNFQAACPSQFDCRPDTTCLTAPAEPPPIDYLAKDYASFRQALLDRITSIHPDWTERNPADLGIALVELLAYAGDQLSYYQDAVANEAYLETARQRVSVRRHARLIGYRMHDGLSAHAFVHMRVSAPLTLGAGQPILTRIIEPLTGSAPPDTVIGAELKETAFAAEAAVFETSGTFHLHPDLNELAIHDWRRQDCCLPAGSTTVDLKGDWTARLGAGDALLLEETRGAASGVVEDADASHRQVVRITGVETAFDPLTSQTLTRVRWDAADALRFPLCVRAQGVAPPIAVARGNLVLASHGQTVTEWYPNEPGSGPGIETGTRPFRFRLQRGPLSYRVKPDSSAPAPVSHLLDMHPREGEPEVLALSVVKGTEVEGDWLSRPDLLSSGPDDRHFTLETDNLGRAQVRFGDGVAGRAPMSGSSIQVKYRVGTGTPGNVAPGGLYHVVEPDSSTDLSAIDSLRNPLASWGAADPEPVEAVKLTAPAVLRSELHRAVTEDDYARAAELSPDVSRAVATFTWTGSWHTVSLTIDPAGSTTLTNEQRSRILALVQRYTQLGYDLRIETPEYLPLEIEIEVCVSRDHFRADVAGDVALALSNRVLPDGTLGFFHPDRFSFGQTLYLSELYAAAASVEGVLSATVTKLNRQGAEPGGELDRGFITPGRREILRLDNDPNFPENGTLRLTMRGGK